MSSLALLGSGQRYMICVTLFCMLHKSKNTWTCKNHTSFACDSCMQCKNMLQNLIPLATPYRRAGWLL